MGMLQDRIALVTGGSRGIGRGICVELAKEGANVGVVYTRAKDEADEVVAELKNLGVDAFPIQANVGVREEAIAMVEKLVEKWGKIDILVNNAGICDFEDFFDISAESWQRAIDVNLGGVFFGSQAAARHMREQGKGSIINIGTVTSRRGGIQQVHYSASKGGVNGLTSSMAVALGQYGIRVNTLLCGGVNTDINRQYWEKEPGEAPKAGKSRLPVGRGGMPSDLGKAAVFYASDNSEWMTGNMVPVDGGFTVM